MKKDNTYKSTKRTFWVAAAFYFLIAFEFAYMAGPFAAFFYGAYSPALGLIGEIPILSELIRFFLPHIVQQTASPLIDAHNLVGGILAAAGFLVFLIGACKVYYNKLTKKGAVTGGLYKYIRHPQYAAFIVCSFGLLLVWPRYIVAVMFVTMLFAYYLLARAEEKECTEKFGKSYSSYMEHTNMFFPSRLLKIKIPTLFPDTKTKGQRVLLGLGFYIAVLTVTLGAAAGLNTLALNSLYADYTERSATVSLCEMEPVQIRTIMNIVLADQMIVGRLQAVAPNAAFLNYVLRHSGFRRKYQGIILKTSLEKGISFCGDQKRLMQLVVILTDNAIKYMGRAGQIDVLLKQDEKQIELTITDSGVGIAEAHIGKIFDRFYRISKAHSKENDGSGLGLSIAKWIVESHHGTINVKSALDIWTSFFVVLPK